VAYQLKLPDSWKIHKVFHVSKLRQAKPDEFERIPPKVTLHVRGENWNAKEITDAKIVNGRLEFLVTWILPEGHIHKLWELSSRIKNDAPDLITEFY
jgi:hypothetical protein